MKKEIDMEAIKKAYFDAVSKEKTPALATMIDEISPAIFGYLCCHCRIRQAKTTTGREEVNNDYGLILC